VSAVSYLFPNSITTTCLATSPLTEKLRGNVCNGFWAIRDLQYIASVLPIVIEFCMHADVCSALNVDVDFIRLYECINWPLHQNFGRGERALPRPPGESTRGKRREAGPPRFMTDRRYC